MLYFYLAGLKVTSHWLLSHPALGAVLKKYRFGFWARVCMREHSVEAFSCVLWLIAAPPTRRFFARSNWKIRAALDWDLKQTRDVCFCKEQILDLLVCKLGSLICFRDRSWSRFKDFQSVHTILKLILSFRFIFTISIVSKQTVMTWWPH